MDKYCGKCGSLLKATPVSAGYNKKTGTGRWRVRIRCPKKNHLFDGHFDSFILYENTHDIFYFDDTSLKEVLKEYEV